MVATINDMGDSRHKQAMTIQEGKNPIRHWVVAHVWALDYGTNNYWSNEAPVWCGRPLLLNIWYMVVVEGATKKKKGEEGGRSLRVGSM